MTAFTEIIADIDDFSRKDATASLGDYAVELRDEVVNDMRPSSIVTIVDGQRGAPLDRAKSVVEFDFGYAGSVAAEILAMVVAASPFREKRQGANPDTHYRDQHRIFVDGSEVSALPDDLPASAVVVLVNTQPYARKIEGGLSMQAPDGVYEAVARLARDQFGGTVEIDFSYESISGAGPGAPSARDTKSKARTDDNFPAITIKALV